MFRKMAESRPEQESQEKLRCTMERVDMGTAKKQSKVANSERPDTQCGCMWLDERGETWHRTPVGDGH